MKPVFVFLLALFVSNALSANGTRMSVTFQYKGEWMTATFFSQLRAVVQTEQDAVEFIRTADFLDKIRFRNYVLRDRGVTDEESNRWKRGFFDWEPLRHHDEILVLHRGVEPLVRSDQWEAPLGIGDKVVGLIAVDRLGDPFLDSLPAYGDGPHDQLLVEKRLGKNIPRPSLSQWKGEQLPPGVFPHWDPLVRQTFFRPGRILYGDVIQANALFAEDGLWPLLHSLANTYGLFSTGRLIPKTKIIDGLEYRGPFVCIPTMVVWQVFNKMKDLRIKKGSRTLYYEGSGARPLRINGHNQWGDPLLGFGNYVQIMEKTGAEFRQGWTQQFAEKEHFSFVRDVTIAETRFENIEGSRLIRRIVHQADPRIAHHPHSLEPCIEHLVQAPKPGVIELQVPVTIGVSLGHSAPVNFEYKVKTAFPQ
jgi:hypothetical protein